MASKKKKKGNVRSGTESSKPAKMPAKKNMKVVSVKGGTKSGTKKAEPAKKTASKPAKKADEKKAEGKTAAAGKKKAAKSKNTSQRTVELVKKAQKRKAATDKKKAVAKKAAAEKAAKEKAAKEEAAKSQPRNMRLRSQPVEVQEIDVQIQRERKSRLVPFQPRSYGARPKKASPSEVLELLSQYIGKAPALSDRQQPATVVELGVFCIFAMGGNSARVSLDATKRLVAEFPEWNEFRVSEAYEFLEALDGLAVVEPYDRCEQVLEFVNEVYQDQNAVDLEFLRDMTPDDRLVALNRYRSLGPALSHYIVLALQSFEGILFHYSWARVIQRVGLVPRSGSPKKLVASTAAAFEGLDTVSLQINTIDLGETVCQPKSPQCRTCYLVMCCKSRKI